MTTRICRLPKHNAVLLGRDLGNLFKPGFVYEITQVLEGSMVVKCLGASALAMDATEGDYPNANSTIGAIIQSSPYLVTDDEYALYKMHKNS